MIENDLNKPTYSHLRKLGHDISTLHQNAVNIAIKYEKRDKGKWVLNDEQSAILTMLSEFGKETRYYNLNTIIGDKKLMNDPLEQWNCILEYCYWKYTSATKRERLSQDVIS
ncbi:hypothetical protein ACHEMW_004222 [Escherichia coli]